MSRTCKQCRFFQSIDPVIVSRELGTWPLLADGHTMVLGRCHRYPEQTKHPDIRLYHDKDIPETKSAVLKREGDRQYPLVWEEDYCGEWKAKV